MNYIKSLQEQNCELQAQLAAQAEAINAFRRHLSSAKYAPQADGERGDWIATGDVFRWLDSIAEART